MNPTKGDYEKAKKVAWDLNTVIPEKITIIAQALAEERKRVLESGEFKKIEALVRYEGCICPNHQRFNKHACPCTLRHLEISDAFTDFEKFKAEGLGE